MGAGGRWFESIRADQQEQAMAHEDWLHGWPRIGETGVLIGTQVRCVGCGKDCGTTAVALEAGVTFPEREPEWPFDEAGCPVCALKSRIWQQSPEDKLTARMLALRGRR